MVWTRQHADSQAFWDLVAAEDAAWYVATGVRSRDEFFAQGAAETDYYLAMCHVPPLQPATVVVEIGCGVGRMTRRLAELAGRVVAADVSPEMLIRCRRNLADRTNVDYVQLPGDGLLVSIPDFSTDLVFSYITLQHVPTVEAQLRYLDESIRVLRPGGRAAIQVRASGWSVRAVDWIGHLGHYLAGRRTLRAEWRGVRIREPDITATAVRAGARVHLRAHGHRHVWIVIEAPG